MGEECPEVHRLGMSGQRPIGARVTRHCTSFTSVPAVTSDGPPSPSFMPARCPGEPPGGELTNQSPLANRMPHVTMGAVSRAARRPEDDVADADLVRRIRAGDRGAVDDLYDRFRRPAFALARRILG